MGENLTWGVGGQSHLGHGLVESFDDHSGEGKVDTSQGEALCDHRDHAAECSFYLMGKGLNRQRLDSMTSCHIGQAGAHEPCSHRSHVGEEAQGDSPVGELQVCGILWWLAAGDSRSTYRAEEGSSEKSRLPCMVGSPAVVDNP